MLARSPPYVVHSPGLLCALSWPARETFQTANAADKSNTDGRILLIMRAIISRFAPAPTGFLHLGHVVNAIYVWGLARRSSGRVLLRIEDHDRQRSRSSYELAIIEDLTWLGFADDEPWVRQSARGAIYSRALERLRAQGLVYACRCSRADILAALKGRATSPAAQDAGPATGAAEVLSPAADVAQDFGPAYPGSCRTRRVPETVDASLRVRLDPTVVRFVDLRHGPKEQRPFQQCGDMVIRDRDGNWTYQFAVTVDDMDQGVTLVVRGDDLIDSTGRQLQLARLLGRDEPPRFLHHPLIMKSAGLAGSARPQKLSKSDRDTGVRDLRAAGWTPQRVIGHAAFQAGLIAESRDVHASEVSSIMPTFSEVDG